MLKLAMKPGDSIRIGENIKVKLPEDMECNIHLLVDAPKEAEIQRQKRTESVKRDKKGGNVYIINHNQENIL